MNPTGPIRPYWWQWPTVLSLDAPLVAVTWQYLFGAIARVHIGWPETTVVGLSLWLAYAADRWFGGWRIAPDDVRTARHRFYQRYRWPVAGVWLAVLGTDVVVAFDRLTHAELVAGFVLLIPTLLYVLSHQLIHRDVFWRLPKELCVAALVAGGASVFAVAEGGEAWRMLVKPIVLFAGLCFVNVALIALWEREVDRNHGEISLAQQLGNAASLTRALPFVLAGLAALAGAPRFGTAPIAAHCVAASAMLLAIADRLETKAGPRLARVLADFVLLTPAVPLLRGWLER